MPAALAIAWALRGAARLASISSSRLANSSILRRRAGRRRVLAVPC